jgi:hypothetical protein
VEEGLLGGPVSPLEPTRTPQPHNLMFNEGGAKRLENPSTTDHVEVPQPQVAASANGEAHQPLGPVLAESAIIEDGKSTRDLPDWFDSEYACPKCANDKYPTGRGGVNHPSYQTKHPALGI